MKNLAPRERVIGAILLCLIIGCAIVVATYSWRVNHKLANDYAAVAHSYAVANQVEVLMNRVTDGETGERGFVITGRDEYLEPYRLFAATIDQIYAELMALTAADPDQRKQVSLLQSLLLARKNELKNIIDLRRASGLDVARTSASFNTGKLLHDQIRHIVDIVSVNEWRNIRIRNADVAATSRESQRAIVLVTLAVAALGCVILVLGWLNAIRARATRRDMQRAEAERQHLQAELERNFNILARVGELAKIGGWEVELPINRLVWSREVFRIHEIDSDVPPNLHQALDFYAPEGRRQIQAAVDAAAKNGGTWDLELPLITAKGNRIWVRTLGLAVVRDGAIVKLHGMFQDITERKRVDESLKLLNEQLSYARDRAEAASSAKSQFLANMSHEIRTPMNAVLGMLQLLAQTELVRRQLDYVGKAQIAAKSLLVILNDILDFSKIEAGKMFLEVGPLALDGLMRYLAVILSTSVGKKEIETLLDLDPCLPREIKGDSLRLQQVLLNLIGNAVKFTHDGEIVVSLKLLEMDERRVSIEFAVRDTGIGIAEENLQRIFEGFSQAESSTARLFGGTGLGLAISRRLVKLMGGDLQVTSESGAGSRFFFSLSFELVNPQEKAQGKYIPATIPGIAPGQRLQVLVVDDNESTREVLRTMIEALGWRCHTADGGEQALAVLQQSFDDGVAYDVVFMDWKMPGMDGWQTTQRIRDAHRSAHRSDRAPIIVMISAHGREALTERVRDEPAVLDGFLVKPVTASSLFDAVADAQSGVAGVSAALRQRVAAYRLQGLRLLLVEDNLMNQQVAYELLSNEGAQVTVASNGRMGVQAAISAKPAFDVVLMDIQMPDIDGREAAALIRDDPSMYSLPIIAMTANVMAEEKAACLAAGMNDHIGKPVDLDLLVTAILRHCRRPDEAVNPQSQGVTATPTKGTQTAFAADAISDLNAALHRVGEDRKLFVDMAKLFHRTCTTLAADLQRYMLREDKAGAAALLHTLRGNAGTVGATELADYTERLERQLRAADSTLAVEFSVDEFDALIRHSCNELRIFAATLNWDSPSGIMARAVFDKPRFLILLDQLDELMRQKNMRAIQVFDELRAACGMALGAKLTGLEDAINDLNFPLSLERTRVLRESLQ